MSNFAETIAVDLEPRAPDEPQSTDPNPAHSADQNFSTTNTGSASADDLLSLFEWSWDKLAREAPAVASVFAFAYVVGYFYAYDITWFPFFTLTEHLVFALRAIPFAVIAFVGFMVVVNYSIQCNKPSYVWNETAKQCFRWLRYLWIFFLVVAAVCLVAENCLAPGFSLGVVAYGVWYFCLHAHPRRCPIHFLYWGIN